MSDKLYRTLVVVNLTAGVVCASVLGFRFADSQAKSAIAQEKLAKSL